MQSGFSWEDAQSGQFFPKVSMVYCNSSKKAQHQWGGIIPKMFTTKETLQLVHDGWMKWTQNRKNNGKQISSHENKLLQNFKSLRNLLLLTLRISNFALLLAYRPMAYEYVRGQRVGSSQQYCSGPNIGVGFPNDYTIELRLTSTAKVIQACCSYGAFCRTVLSGFPQEYDSVIHSSYLTLVEAS